MLLNQVTCDSRVVHDDDGKGSVGPGNAEEQPQKKAESSQAMVIDNAAAGNCMVEPQLFPLNLNVNIRNDHLGETSLPKDPKSQPNVNDA